MQTYAEAVITAYNENVSRYFPSSKGNFSFYSESYSIKSFISYNGAAIWFEPSLISSFENHNLSERVESIFGGNFSRSPLFLAPSHHVMVIGGQFELNGHPLIVLSNISSVIFEDIYVNQTNTLQAYKCVIIKGSIETGYWTSDNATDDVRELLNSDAKHAFLTSEPINEEIRERYAEPELLALARNIQYRLANDTSYMPSQFALDYKDLEYRATTKFHLPNPTGFLNELLNFLNAQTTGVLPTFPPEPTPTPSPSPTISSNQPDNWGYVILCGFYPIIVFAAHSIVKWKFKDEDWAQFGKDQLIDGVLIGVGYALLAVNFPYKSPNVIPEILLAIIIAVCGSVLTIWTKKKLLTLRSSRVNNAKRSNEKPDQKKNQTPPSK